MPTLVCNSGSYQSVGAASKRAFVLGVLAGSLAITGTAATLVHGYQVVNPPGSYTITGQPIQVLRITAEPAAYQLQGQAASLLHNASDPVLSADVGSYTVTGTASTLEKAVPIGIGQHLVSGTAVGLVYSGATGATLLADSGGYSVANPVPIVLQLAINIDSGEYLLTGTAVTIRAGKGLVASSQARTITGTPATLKRAYRFSSTTGAYTATGSEIVLDYSGSPGNTIAVTPGQYIITGIAAALPATRDLAAASGSYNITGQIAQLRRILNVNVGVYSTAGQAVSLLRTVILPVISGAYEVTGIDPVLIAPVASLVALPGVYVSAGPVVALQAQRQLVAAAGSYNLAGQSATLRATQIVLASGQHTLTGTAATLTASRTGRWRQHPKQPSLTKKQPTQLAAWEPVPTAAGV